MPTEPFNLTLCVFLSAMYVHNLTIEKNPEAPQAPHAPIKYYSKHKLNIEKMICFFF